MPISGIIHLDESQAESFNLPVGKTDYFIWDFFQFENISVTKEDIDKRYRDIMRILTAKQTSSDLLRTHSYLLTILNNARDEIIKILDTLSKSPITKADVVSYYGRQSGSRTSEVPRDNVIHGTVGTRLLQTVKKSERGIPMIYGSLPDGIIFHYTYIDGTPTKAGTFTPIINDIQYTIIISPAT